MSESYGPSGGYAARDAARLVFNVSGDFEAAADTLYDPALGLDASICVRDMPEWLRRNAPNDAPGAWQSFYNAAALIEAEFERLNTVQTTPKGTA